MKIYELIDELEYLDSDDEIRILIPPKEYKIDLIEEGMAGPVIYVEEILK